MENDDDGLAGELNSLNPVTAGTTGAAADSGARMVRSGGLNLPGRTKVSKGRTLIEQIKQNVLSSRVDDVLGCFSTKQAKLGY